MDYDKEYFECGLEKGASCYQNYIWMPEATMSFAMRIIDYFKLTPNKVILDFGCAKGFLVKAFRLLHRQAYGYDISEYAISCVPEYTKKYCSNIIPNNFIFDFCIAKDVFEHMEEKELIKTMNNLQVKTLFVVVPLGENGKYRSTINDFDKTHKLCIDEKCWTDIFNRTNYKLKEFSFSWFDIKEDHPYESHGFYVLEREV